MNFVLTLLFTLFVSFSFGQNLHEDTIRVTISLSSEWQGDSIHVRVIKTEYVNIFEFQIDPEKLLLLQGEIGQKIGDKYKKEGNKWEGRKFEQVRFTLPKKDIMKE